MSFSIVLNSSLGTQVSSGNNSIISYNISWDAVPDWQGKYKVGMSFITRQNDTTANSVGLVTVNWGAVHNCYTATAANGTANNSVLGYVRPAIIGTAQQLYSDFLTNSPVIIQQKPKNNIFSVTFLNTDGTLFSSLTGIYFLTIYFDALSE